MTKIIVVNEKDEIIGYKDRDDRNETDIIRVSALILLNSKNQTLIARRALNKILDSGKWGPAAAGTLEEGESYLSNIIKEAQEEIGFKASKKDLSFGLKKFVETSHKYFLQIFITETNLPLQNFRIYRKEVSEIRWVQVPELIAWFKKKPKNFTASFSTVADTLNPTRKTA